MSFHAHYGLTGLHPSRATGETPFFSMYEVEAVLPLEVTMCSVRLQTYVEAVQD
jgi:hypothetical protein